MEGDSFEAGKLGGIEVGSDGGVLLGDPFPFNADNIGEFDFKPTPPLACPGPLMRAG